MPNQLKRTDRIRQHLDNVLQNCADGTILFSSDIAATLAKRCRTVTVNNVGMALRERDDVVLVENGVWRKRG